MDGTKTVQVVLSRATSPSAKHTSHLQQCYVSSKTLLQQYPVILNRGCQLTQTDVYNSRKMVVYISRYVPGSVQWYVALYTADQKSALLT